MERSTSTKVVAAAFFAGILAVAMLGCSGQASGQGASSSMQENPADAMAVTSEAVSSEAPAAPETAQGNPGNMGGMDTQPGQTNDKGYTANDNGLAITETLNPDDAFTERDLEQTADTSKATVLKLESNKQVTVSNEGVYVVSGIATDATVVVDADDSAKVQLVLDGVSITNADFPAIYVKNADKVFVTLQGQNTLEVTGEFVADGDTNTDAVIFSKDDLCLNGAGSLTINSTEHAVVSKDDLKVTGGTYTISAEAGSALRANDSVRIADGTFTIKAEDGIKAKNDDDNELGYIYIKDGSFAIDSTDNGIQGYAFVWIDGGTFNLSGEECIEGTFIQINDGTIDIDSTDDGINASVKSSVYTPTIEINGGKLTVSMASGDTDALDSNGYLYINGGIVSLNAQFPFDYAWGGAINGGEVYVNGQQVTELYDAMGGGMGPDGEMGGGFGGQMPDGEMPQNGQVPDDSGFGGRQRPDRGEGGFGGGTPPEGAPGNAGAQGGGAQGATA